LTLPPVHALADASKVHSKHDGLCVLVHKAGVSSDDALLWAAAGAAAAEYVNCYHFVAQSAVQAYAKQHTQTADANRRQTAIIGATTAALPMPGAAAFAKSCFKWATALLPPPGSDSAATADPPSAGIDWQLACVAAQLLRLERSVFALLAGAWTQQGGRAKWIAQVREACGVGGGGGSNQRSIVCLRSLLLQLEAAMRSSLLLPAWDAGFEGVWARLPVVPLREGSRYELRSGTAVRRGSLAIPPAVMRRLARRMTKEVLPTGVVVWSGAQGPGRGPAAPARVAARTLRQAWCTDVATAATAAQLALQVRMIDAYVQWEALKPPPLQIKVREAATCSSSADPFAHHLYDALPEYEEVVGKRPMPPPPVDVGKPKKVVEEGVTWRVPPVQYQLKSSGVWAHEADVPLWMVRQFEQRERTELNDEKLYCVCQTLWDEDRAMIGCDSCDGWYHWDCVGLPEQRVPAMDKYKCVLCCARDRPPDAAEARVTRELTDAELLEQRLAQQSHPIPRNVLEGLVLQTLGRDVSKQKLARWRVASKLPTELMSRLAAAYEADAENPDVSFMTRAPYALDVPALGPLAFPGPLLPYVPPPPPTVPVRSSKRGSNADGETTDAKRLRGSDGGAHAVSQRATTRGEASATGVNAPALLSSSKMTSEAYDSCLAVLDTLRAKKDDDGRELTEAFEWLPTVKQLPEYYQEIANPLDLQTIERSLGRGRVSKYETVEEFVAEVDQMWLNARVFNDAGSQLYVDAGVLRRESIHIITKLFPSIPMWNPLSKKAFGAQSVQEMQAAPGVFVAEAKAVEDRKAAAIANAAAAEAKAAAAEAKRAAAEAKRAEAKLAAEAAAAQAAAAAAAEANRRTSKRTRERRSDGGGVGESPMAGSAPSRIRVTMSGAATAATKQPKAADIHPGLPVDARVLGLSVGVYWPPERLWYKAWAVWYDQATGQHTVAYESDGTQETMDVGKEPLEWDAATVELLLEGASGAAAPAAPSRAAARKAGTASLAAGEETVGAVRLTARLREKCVQLLDTLAALKDSTGRKVAELFVQLPSKRELPEYYQVQPPLLAQPEPPFWLCPNEPSGSLEPSASACCCKSAANLKLLQQAVR
jgi:hypothetical protein